MVSRAVCQQIHVSPTNILFLEFALGFASRFPAFMSMRVASLRLGTWVCVTMAKLPWEHNYMT